MERNITTKHFRNDRIERATYIAQTIGFGEVVREINDYYQGRFERRQLTETGVIIVRNIDNVIVTMFIASIKQVKGMYDNGAAPSWIIAKAKKNAQKYAKGQPDR